MKVLSAHTNPVSQSDMETELRTVDRSSISRTLTLFLEKGVVHAIDDGSGSVKYELCHGDDDDHDNDRHVHFHCRGCNATICLDIPVPHVPLPEGFTESGSNFVVHGLCDHCNRSRQD